MYFPDDFIWGTASASYQIEGGAYEDGKGLSIWDVFSHEPGKTSGGHNGDIACDAYHRLEEDLDLMKALGIRNYRFSVSWPRILPDGEGRIAKAGLSYYDRLIDGCLARGITPWMTLYHWDLPQALQEKGGWERRETADAFAAFTEIVVSHFADRVHRYITINEPQIAIGLGLHLGLHAPGLRLAPEDVFRAWHHLLLAHGKSVRVIRSCCPQADIGVSSTGALGYLPGHMPGIPRELEAYSFTTPEEISIHDNWPFNHQWFLDPVCLGKYPDDPASPFSAFVASVDPADMETLCQPLDFIGMNTYNGTELDPDAGFAEAEKYPGYPRTSLKWPVTPPVLYWGPKQIWHRYGLPIVISENGQGCNDRIFRDGKVHDPDRVDFLESYLEELSAAVAEGVPVRGYFHWSFTDNFEWHSGYDDRFGLVYIDYRTQKRIPKDSALWYSNLIKTNGR